METARRTRMQDVAEAAGVSRTTASFVLSGRAASIPDATRQRVLSAASRMGYQHNRLATSLRQGRSRLIGLVIAGIENPFFASFIATTERLVHDAGYELLLDATADASGMKYEGTKIAGWPIDGVLMWGHDRSHLARIVGAGAAETLPLVQFADLTDKRDADGVYCNHKAAVEGLWDHLRGRGYERIACVVPQHLNSARDDRLVTYHDLCAREGTCPEVLVAAVQQDERGRRAARQIGIEIAARPPHLRPRAVICYNDLFAIGLIHGLRRGGLRVPEDVAVAGIDGIDEGQDMDRPLTSALFDMELLCRTALDILLRRMAEKNAGNPIQMFGTVYLPVKILIGETT